MERSESENISEVHYPGVVERVKAAFVDFGVVLLVIMITTYIFNMFEPVPVVAKKIALLVIFGLYEPLLVSFYGGTIGHFAMKLRVRNEQNENKNIFILLAFIRYAVKLSLGWISFLTVGGNKKKMAIHDLLVRSIVVYK